MEHLTTRLPRSSDPTVIIRLEDGTVLDLNQAFSAATGHAPHELRGRKADDVLLGLGSSPDPLLQPQSADNVPIGLGTKAGDLRAGRLSSLVLEVEGQRVALCSVRDVKDPTPGERRAAAREGLDRVLRTGDRGPESAAKALQAFARPLRWESGALWRIAPRLGRLRCVAVWSASRSDAERLEETTRDAAFPSAMESVGSVWLHGRPTWVPDTSADPRFSRSRGEAGVPEGAWFAFPVFGPGGVIGAAEFLSREPRQPDAELVAVIDDFGARFGRFLEDVDVLAGRRADPAATGSSGTREAPSETVSDAFRVLAGALAAATEALERNPIPPAQVESAALLGELTASFGRLNQLLEEAAARMRDASPPAGPWTPAADGTGRPSRLPTGLTLKAVSRRTGIPAATLRTWQRRYGFMRPERSLGGYRLYSEQDIDRIEQVKYLVAQGVRIGTAMEAVIRAAEDASVDSGGVRSAG
jgi:MerR HTH family regulatory protein/GAF domain